MDPQNEITNESASIKALASNTLKRLERNRVETKRNSPPNAAVFHVPHVSRVSSVSDDYEERLAIAEYDGQQNDLQVQRIAYLDAFVSVLVTLPQESLLEKSKGKWLDHRIKEAEIWLSTQGLEQPE